MIDYVLEGKAKSYVDVPAGAKIVRVDGREVLGLCEVCGRPVFRGCNGYEWMDGPVTHERCPRPSTIAKQQGMERE